MSERRRGEGRNRYLVAVGPQACAGVSSICVAPKQLSGGREDRTTCVEKEERIGEEWKETQTYHLRMQPPLPPSR
jgi:hypothetical protein